MKIEDLKPSPNRRENFLRKRQRFIPDKSGCYVLTTFQDDILYVGLTNDLRQRFGKHLDDPQKTSKTENGRAFFFHWLECDELNKVERTWLNDCVLTDGALPILNKINSPISV